jgi:hypothetical protein
VDRWRGAPRRGGAEELVALRAAPRPGAGRGQAASWAGSRSCCTTRTGSATLRSRASSAARSRPRGSGSTALVAASARRSTRRASCDRRAEGTRLRAGQIRNPRRRPVPAIGADQAARARHRGASPAALRRGCSFLARPVREGLRSGLAAHRHSLCSRVSAFPAGPTSEQRPPRRRPDPLSQPVRAREPLRFVRPDTSSLMKCPLCRHFRRSVWATGLGHETTCCVLARQQQVPICRHFERRERRDSNPRPPA